MEGHWGRPWVGGGGKWEGDSRMTSKFWTEGWGCLPGRRNRGGGAHLEVGGGQWVKDASGKSQGGVSRHLGPWVWESKKRSGPELEIWGHWSQGFKQSHPGKGKKVKHRTLGLRKRSGLRCGGEDREQAMIQWGSMWGTGCCGASLSTRMEVPGYRHSTETEIA